MQAKLSYSPSKHQFVFLIVHTRQLLSTTSWFFSQDWSRWDACFICNVQRHFVLFKWQRGVVLLDWTVLIIRQALVDEPWIHRGFQLFTLGNTMRKQLVDFYFCTQMSVESLSQPLKCWSIHFHGECHVVIYSSVMFIAPVRADLSDFVNIRYFDLQYPWWKKWMRLWSLIHVPLVPNSISHDCNLWSLFLTVRLWF